MKEIKKPPQELLDEIHDAGYNGMHCSQCAFRYGARKLGFDETTAVRMATPFAGGFYCGERCGALSGALMALGMKYGHGSPEEKPKELQLIAKFTELNKRFYEKYGSYYCKDLLGHDLSKPGVSEAVDEGKVYLKCVPMIADVCMLLDELL